MPAALCHPCQMDCNLVCLLCLTIRLPADFHSRRSHTLSSASPGSRATGQETYSSSSCSSSMPKGFLVAVAPCALGAEPLPFCLTAGPGGVEGDTGCEPFLILAVSDTPSYSSSHLTTSRCPFRQAMWMGSQPTLVVAIRDTPSYSVSHLTSSRCPSPHAQCMGCEPSLALAVSDTPCCTASHLTSSRCPFPHAPCMGCKLRGLNLPSTTHRPAPPTT
jgi:hypothetical protein